MRDILNALVRFIGWQMPSFVVDLAGQLITGIVWLVGEIGKGSEPGEDKLRRAVEIGRDFVDEYMDDLPVWSSLSEERRDRVLAAMVELVLFAELLSGVEDDPAEQGAASMESKTRRRVALKKLKSKKLGRKSRRSKRSR